MLDFDKIVNLFLLEEEPSAPPAPGADSATAAPSPASTNLPVPLGEFIAKYKQIFPTENLDQIKLVSLIDGLYSIRDTNYLTGAKIKPYLKYIRVFDVLYKLKETYKLKTKDILLATKEEDLRSYIEKIINNKNAKNWTVPESLDPKIQSAYNELAGEANKLGAVALATLNDKSILGAVQEIIARRSNAFASVMALQKPSTPFAGLLEKIFLTPEKYISGQAAVTDDFREVVDDLYIEKIFNIALQTRELYNSLVQPSTPEEIADEKELLQTAPTDQELQQGLQPKENDVYQSKRVLYKMIPVSGKPVWHKQNKTTKKFVPVKKALAKSITKLWQNQQTKQVQPVNAGLELFATLVEQILLEADISPITTTSSPTKDYTTDTSTYTNFFKTGALPDEFSKGPDGKQKFFNIKTIFELGTPESQNLINSLQGIAQYTKSKDGVIAKTAAATQALQGVAAFGGAKLYT